MTNILGLGPGDVIVREGDTDKTIFLVKSGRLNVFISKDGRPKKVGEINEGELLGVMAFVTGSPRSATVIAATECELVKVSGESFNKTMDKLPAWLQGFIKTLMKRIKEQNNT